MNIISVVVKRPFFFDCNIFKISILTITSVTNNGI